MSQRICMFDPINKHTIAYKCYFWWTIYSSHDFPCINFTQLRGPDSSFYGVVFFIYFWHCVVLQTILNWLKKTYEQWCNLANWTYDDSKDGLILEWNGGLEKYKFTPKLWLVWDEFRESTTKQVSLSLLNFALATLNLMVIFINLTVFQVISDVSVVIKDTL